MKHSNNNSYRCSYLSILALLLALCLGASACVPTTAQSSLGANEGVQKGELIPPGARFEAGFSPKGNAEQLILDAINNAKSSILVAAYSFTSKPISLALLDAHKRGLKVQVVADKGSANSRYSAVTFLANQKVPVRLNGKYSIFHHKFMVFDGQHLKTGSFNYSANAAKKNAENVLLLYNVPALAKKYTLEWERLWGEGVDLTPQY